MMKKLSLFPVSVFAIFLGLSGSALAWQKMEEHMHWLSLGSTIYAFMILGGFSVAILLYVWKMFAFPQEVAKEWAHPIRMNFFPLFSIIPMIFSLIFVGMGWSETAFWVSAFAAFGQLLFTMAILSSWMHKENLQLKHINPSFFIPVVGMILVPITAFGQAYLDAAWFFYAVGLIFWFVFMTMVFYRVIFHDPLPKKLMPTLFILLAPPAIGFIAYVKMVGVVDSFARILYGFSVFLFLLLMLQWPYIRTKEFFLSSWAYSFPLAAFSIASLLMTVKVHSPVSEIFAWGAFAILFVVIGRLLWDTIVAVKRQEICIEE